MSGRKGSKQGLLAALSALAIACALSSCASSSSDATKAADASSSDAATLLDSSTDGTKPEATDVADSSAFSDLQKDEKKNDATGLSSAAASDVVADGDTYYKSLGGETLRRVALTLYSDKSFSKKLLEKNPDLKGVKKLAADQKVFFEMESARPEPRFLTKDLLDRYAQPLAERLQSAEKGMPTTNVTLGKGESLQDLSQRLYGTHRYWTEIYLANRDKIKNYDRVPAGLTVSVVTRQGMAKAEEAPVAAAQAAPAPTPEPEVLAEVQETPAPPAKMGKPAPVPAVTPIAAVPTQPTAIQPQPLPVAKEAPKDPIPEIPPMAEKSPPHVQSPKPIPAAVDLSDSSSSANSSLRRILYVALIVLLGASAFYFTRSPKRPRVDMLDLNADAGSRPKLAPKDNQTSQLG